eukprot:1160908-Pelagomonas_calceolata.AAC.3
MQKIGKSFAGVCALSCGCVVCMCACQQQSSSIPAAGPGLIISSSSHVALHLPRPMSSNPPAVQEMPHTTPVAGILLASCFRPVTPLLVHTDYKPMLKLTCR